MSRFALGLFVLCCSVPAHGWSPGPFPLHRMAIFGDACLQGKVTKVRQVGQDASFVIMLAEIKVKRWLYGGKGKIARVLFHSKTDGRFDSALEMKAGQHVLLFVRRHHHVREHVAPKFLQVPKSLKRPLYVVQFAKARNVGYLLTLEATASSGLQLKGFMDKKDPKEWQKALRIIRAHRPAATVKGMRAILWSHSPVVARKKKLHLTLHIRNMGKKTLWLWKDRSALRLQLEIYRKKRRIKRMSILLVDKRSMGGALEHVSPGESIRFQFSSKQLRLPRGQYSIKADFRSLIRKPFLTTKPLWQGKLQSNAMHIKIN